MVNNLKQKTKNAQPLWRYILSPKRVAFLFIAILIFTGFALVSVEREVNAATGINQTINFQGKVVNSNGTNVADGQYSFVFRIYDVASGGSHLWTETQGSVQVTAGVFRVSLGSVTPISGVDFNTDNIYLGINFNSDGEMTPRVRFATVPYAMNALKVAGLTVTDTTGTLTIANSKVFTVNNTIGFSGTDGTTFTLPGASGTIVTLDASQILVNKTIGSSGLTFSGASTDITTGTNENLTIAANGTGNVLVQSGSGGQSALIVDKTGSGDIFAASSSGIPKFVIKSDGTASSSAGFVVDGVGSVQSTNNQTLTVGGGSTGDLVIGRTSQRVYLPGFDTCTALETSGGILSCGSDASGGGGDNFWQYNSATGIVANGNLTTDLLLGATSTASAKFAVLGIAGTTVPTASVSAQNASGQALVLGGDGSIQSVRNNTLTIGGLSTGNIAFQSGVPIQPQMTIYQDADSYPKVGIGTISPIFAGPYVGLQVDKGNILVRGQDNYSSQPAYIYFGDSGNYVNAQTGQKLSLQGYHGIKFNAGSSPVEYMTLSSIGLLGLGTQSPITQLHVSRDLTLPVTGKALVILDQLENQDILAASASGTTKFVIKNDGTASSSAGLTIDGAGNIQSTNNNQLVVGGGTTGTLVLGRTGQDLRLGSSTFANCSALEAVNGVLSCGSDASGGGDNFWQYNTSTGIIAPGNLTAATLFGNTASLSATFRINGSAGSGINPVASVSANTSYAGFVFDQRGAGDVLTASTSGITQLVLTNTGALGLGLGNGNSPTAKLDVNGMASISSQLSFRNGSGAVQTTAGNTLTLGGSTTGDIYLRPGNSQGIVKILHQDDGSSGLLITTNETQNTDKTGRIKFGSYDVTDGYVTGMLASSEVAANQLFIGGGSSTENAATVLRFRTAQNVGTLAGTERMRIDNYGWTGIGEIGDANTALQSQLYVTGGSQGANAAVIINQTGISTNDILAASASGITKFTIKNNGSIIVGSNATAAFGTLDVRANNTNGGTIPVASISGSTSFAALSILQSGAGDLITASVSGVTASEAGMTKFTVTSRGSVVASDFNGHDIVLGTSSASMISALKGYTGYTNFSGGIGTGGTGKDSLTPGQRLTSSGNLINIGSVQAGETLLSAGGTFGAATNYSVATNPRYTAIGDVNGDGYADLAVSNSGSNTVSILFNTGNGAFAPKVDYTTGAFPTGVAIGDVNGDGRPDLAVGGGTNSSVSILINNGGGTFAAKRDYLVGSSVQSIVMGDLNGDGKADLATANNSSTNMSVLINNGDGTFAPRTDYTTGSLPTFIAMGDLNGDGYSDLAVANNGSTSVSVFINNGNGTFAAKSDLTAGANPRSVAIADLNGDGKADIVAGNNTDATVSVFLNNGGSFANQATYGTAANPQGLAVGDLNGDGDVDIATANNTGGNTSVLLNNGNGTFATKVDYTAGNTPYAVAIGDLNNDGKQDLVVTNNGAGTNVSVFLNLNLTMFFAEGSSGKVGIGTTSLLASFDVRANSRSGGTLAVASVSGATSFASLTVDNTGVGDIFTASTGGVTKFTVRNTGALKFSNYTTAGGLLYTDGSGNMLQVAQGGSGLCLIGNGSSAPGWGGCTSGSAANNWLTLNSATGTLFPLNTTLDFLGGGTSTASANFHIYGNSSQGTVAAASVSANTSFAGFVVDNRGSGDLLTASSAGMTRFTIFQNGNVTIGNTSNQGYKLDVQGSVRIGNNTATSDIVKQTTPDFTVSGSSISTNNGINTVSTSGNQLKLVTDLIGAGGTPAAPAADQNTGTNVTTGAVAFQRPDRKFVVYVGGATTSKIYDPVTGLWGNGPSASGTLGAGARAFQRQNGSFLIVHGNAATTTNVYQPGGSSNFGTITAGPATTGSVGAGSQIIRRTDGKILIIHGNTSTTSSVHDPVTATGTTSLIGSFIAGPATTGNVVAGSFVLPAQNGKWIVGLGGATTTNVYDPSSQGVGGGGGFSAGPALTTGTPGAGTHVIQLPDGRFMVLIGGSSNTQIYDQISNTFTAGPALATDTLGAGAHSFQRSDGKWIVVVGGNSKNLQLYDPTSGANGSFSQLTGASGLQGASNAGAGSLSIQRPDGKYVVVHGNTTQLTTLFDAGWNTSGTWTSEDINNTKISTYSAMMWTANPQSANNNARLDAETITFEVKTGDTTVSLGNNPYFGIHDSGGLVKTYGNSQYAKIRVTFTSPVRSYPSGVTGIISQTNIWEGEGGVFYRRSLLQPTVSSLKIQNPLISYGDPTNGADPSFGRNFATASALMEGVTTDSSNRLTLQTLRNTPTASASGGIIIASASANLTGNAGAGSHTIERNSGKFIVIHGNSLTTTSIYDPDTNTFSVGPTLPNTVGAGAHSFLLPDGRFFVVLGGTTNRTAIFDPQSNVFYSGPSLYGNVGSGAHSFIRPDGSYLILNGGGTSATNIIDPFTMAITQGPFTAGTTPNVGGGALTIKRPDGRFLVVLGNGNAVATGTNIYDAATNTFAAGPALVGGAVNTGGNAIQLNTGRIVLFKSTATSNYYDPIQNTFAAGATSTANGAGAFVILRSDGKIFKANGGNAATTNIYDPQVNTVLTGTSAPTLPCNVNTGGHVFQRQTGEYVAICGGGTANTMVIDAGWNLGGSYTSEQIQVPDLSGTSSIFWKNAGQGEITVKYRTAATKQALGVASWRDAQASGSYIMPTSGDSWIQLRFDLQGELQDLPGSKTRVWNASDAGGNMVYYRAVQAPILQYWKLVNTQDPSVLTLTSGNSNLFRFSADGQAYTSDNGAWNSGGADLAERYTSRDTLEAGDVVSLDRLTAQNTKRSNVPYDQNAMGVVSTQPGFVAGAFTENSYPIALVGRVPIKVSTENGEIKAGDYLTSASIPGYAMKATVAGRVLGQAMEGFDSATQAVDCPKYGAGSLPATKCGTITIFVNLTSYNGESVEVAMTDEGFKLKEEELPVIAGMDFAQGTDTRRQQEVLGFLKTRQDNGQQLFTDKLYATQEVISPQIVTDLLVAKKIKAESIEGLEIITGSIEKLNDQLASQSAGKNFVDRLTTLSAGQANLESQMASLSANLEKIGALNLLEMITEDPTAIEAVIVNNFASYGTATLSEASVLGSLTVGSGSVLSIGAGSIDTLGQDLSIQGLKQGAVTFFGGLITFDTDGKANFKEDVVFEKNVAVRGVLSASSLSVTDLKLGLGPVTILSDTEVEATSAAGLVILKKDTKEVKVNNPLVKENSFIFITPKTRTLQDLFLIEQFEAKQEGEISSFTVGVDEKAYEDIKFNYLIVN